MWQEKLTKLHADLVSGFIAFAEPMKKMVEQLSGPLKAARVVEAPATRVEENVAPRPAQPAPRLGSVVPSGPIRPVPAAFTMKIRSLQPDGVGVDKQLGKGERSMLIAIAQHGDGVTREALTVLTGYKRSTRDAYLQRLGVAGFTNPIGNIFLATEAGIAQLGSDFQPLPTGSALREHWLRELPEGERAVLSVLLPAYPSAVDRDLISEATGYKRSTRDAYLQRLGARKLVVDTRDGMLASDMLFDPEAA
jgi:hypothetical protein